MNNSYPLGLNPFLLMEHEIVLARDEGEKNR